MNENVATPVTPETADAPRQEGFLDRWSRVKREVKGGAVPPGTMETVAAPELPSLETLAAQGMDADFSVFMQQGVDAAVRRAAIQQLFKQPAFNVMDGLDVYIEDFNLYEALPASELPGLAHAHGLLFPEPEPTEAAATPEPVAETETGTEQEEATEVSPKEQE